MPAGLGALRDDDIGPGLHRFLRLSQGLHLTNQFRACPVDGRREWAWVAERQHNGGRLMGECSIQELWMLREAPGDEAATNSRITGASPFAFDPTVISVTATEQAQAACVADCGGEPTARDEVHWSQQNRVLDAEYPVSRLLMGIFTYSEIRRSKRQPDEQQRQPSLPVRLFDRSQVHRPGQRRTAPNLPRRWPKLSTLVDRAERQPITRRARL